MKRISYFLSAIMLMFAVTCNDTNNEDPEKIVLLKGVSGVSIENMEAAAAIGYTLPAGGDVQGAKIVYTLITGGDVFEKIVPKESGSSIELKGFGDTEEHKVSIFAMYSGNRLSVGVTVTVSPLPTIYRPVSDVEVENFVGKAIISYTLPDVNDNLKGVNVVYSDDEETVELFVSKENSSFELDGFYDSDERKLIIYVVYGDAFDVNKEYISYGVQAVVNPLPHISDIEVENFVGKATISYTIPLYESALGVKVVNSGEETFVPKAESSILLDGFNEASACTVMLYAVYPDGKISAGILVTVRPLPHISNIQVENQAGGAIISYTLSDDKDLLGIRVVYSLTEDGEEIEEFFAKEIDSFELSDYDDTDEHTVTIYVKYNYKETAGFEVTIKPLPQSFDPVTDIEVENTEGGAVISYTLPNAKSLVSTKVCFAYGPGGRVFEIIVPKPDNSVELKGYSNTKEHPVTVYALYPDNNISEGVEVNIKPLPVTDAPVGPIDLPLKIGDLMMWSLFDAEETDEKERNGGRLGDRGDLFPGSSNLNRTFSNSILKNPWMNNSGNSTGTPTLYAWEPGGDGLNHVNLTNYVSSAPTNTPIPYPLYVTFDLGRRAVYTRMAFQVRCRNTPSFNTNMPVEFVVWGCNNPKKIEEVGDGSREANLKYWTAETWDLAGGTDAWKNDWTKIAEFTYLLEDGANAGINRMEDGAALKAITLTGVDLQRYRGQFNYPIDDPRYFFENGTGLGYDFDLTSGGVTQSFRYLRWEIKSLNRDEKNDPSSPRLMQLWSLKYWGTYDE